MHMLARRKKQNKKTHTHSIHTCKYTLTGHEKKNSNIHTPPPTLPPSPCTHAHSFSSPATLSFFSSIIVVFHNHPETSGVWDELMVQMTGPRHAFKIVALGPKIGKKKKEISKVREKWSYQHIFIKLSSSCTLKTSSVQQLNRVCF